MSQEQISPALTQGKITVGELIDLLRHCPEDAEVLCYTDEGNYVIRPAAPVAIQGVGTPSAVVTIELDPANARESSL